MVKHQFQFSSKAEKDFADLPKLIQKNIIKKLQFFENLENPLSKAKKLINMSEKYRFRVGDYRIIITPKSKNSPRTLVILLILKIGHRKNIYNS